MALALAQIAQPFPFDRLERMRMVTSILDAMDAGDERMRVTRKAERAIDALITFRDPEED